MNLKERFCCAVCGHVGVKTDEGFYCGYCDTFTEYNAGRAALAAHKSGGEK